jgi:hypothetical protein
VVEDNTARYQEYDDLPMKMVEMSPEISHLTQEIREKSAMKGIKNNKTLSMIEEGEAEDEALNRQNSDNPEKTLEETKVEFNAAGPEE